MNIDIKFKFDNGTHNEILFKVKKQIGNNLDNLTCAKHRLPPHISIVNIKLNQPKDIIEFKVSCCCDEFTKKVEIKLEFISNGFIFRVI